MSNIDMFGRRILLTLTALALTSTGFAAEAPPPVGQPKDYQLPTKTTFALDNGMQVTLVPFGSVPKVSIVLNIRSGNLNEGEDTWLADLAGELMTEGAADMDSAMLAQTAAELGGGIGVSTGAEMTSISMGSLSDQAPAAIALVAAVAQQPTFPEAELDRIRQDFLRNLSIARTQPNGQAAMAFYPRMYGDHAFSRIYPSNEQLLGYTIDDVKAYYQNNFGARRSHLYVTGQFDEGLVSEAIVEQFSNWLPGPEPLIDIPVPSTTGSLQIVDRPGSPQSTVLIGIPVMDITDPDYPEFQMTNSVLGGAGFLSRFFRNIREEKGYSYDPGSSTRGHYRDNVWVFRANINTPDTGAALQEFFDEIERLQQEPPAGDELALIRGYRGGIFVLANASRGGIISTLGMMDLHGLPDTYLTEYLSRMQQVTAEQVSAMAKSQLPVEGMTVVVVGDRSVIEPQLAEIDTLSDYFGE
ncbi:MAG: pitrilysin family protein [Gammaproteobacteria bacterium]